MGESLAEKTNPFWRPLEGKTKPSPRQRPPEQGIARYNRRSSTGSTGIERELGASGSTPMVVTPSGDIIPNSTVQSLGTPEAPWGDIHLVNALIAIPLIIDGGGAAITTGQKGHLEIPFDCTITGWTILADQSGSIVVDIWKDSYANFPPTVADTIAGSEKPTLSTAQKNQDFSLTTWKTLLSAGDVLAFNVDSATTVTRVLVSLRAKIK